MALIVEFPGTRVSEREYILGEVLENFLGLDWMCVPSDRTDTCITLQGHSGTILMPDIFFQILDEEYLTSATLPAQPLRIWRTKDEGIDCPIVSPDVPIIYGDLDFPERGNNQYGNQNIKNGKGISLPIDIFGSAFFMLTRYEEIVKPDRDIHDRFPATASLSFQEGFLNRPIIDEYVEILWAALHRLWPLIERKPQKRKLCVTCDVDSPYQVDYSRYMMARGMMADLLKRRSPKLALSNLHKRFQARRGDFSGDPYLENIDWMMDVNERAGNRIAFYFITDYIYPAHPAYDPIYSMDQPIVRKLVRSIHERGHEIGLHPSYNTYLNLEQTKHEADILRQTLDVEGIDYTWLGGRQHYLRWQTPQTARNLEAAGMNYDSTLTYADCPGFRCGTSRDFIMYDVEQRRAMQLMQRPLVLMECSVLSACYLGMEPAEEALNQMLQLKERSLLLGGNFTFLWHNSNFFQSELFQLYQKLL